MSTRCFVSLLSHHNDTHVTKFSSDHLTVYWKFFKYKIFEDGHPVIVDNNRTMCFVKMKFQARLQANL